MDGVTKGNCGSIRHNTPIIGVDPLGMPVYRKEDCRNERPRSQGKPQEKNELGVRPDVFGWAFMHENERYNDRVDPSHDPGDEAVCPFCSNQVGEFSSCRTFYPQHVIFQGGLLKGSVSSRMRFFYRYHNGCFDKNVDECIEATLKSLAPSAMPVAD